MVVKMTKYSGNISLTQSKKRLALWGLFLMAFIITSCSELTQIIQQVNMKEPQANVEKVRITSLSFKKVDLNFDIAVTNPNPIAIQLAGFDYDLLLNNRSFVKGDHKKSLKIEAGGKSNVAIPISLTFADVYHTFKSLQGVDSIKYQLKMKLGFNVPVLGVVKIPVSKSGHIPNLHMPSISLGNLKLKNIGFTGAQLDLGIKIKNPNAINFTVNKLNYQLDVNGANWLSGLTDQPIQIEKKGESEIHLPITLNFIEMGMSVYNLLTSGQKLEYHLKGKADFLPPLKIMNSFVLPFDKEGKINLIK